MRAAVRGVDPDAEDKQYYMDAKGAKGNNDEDEDFDFEMEMDDGGDQSAPPPVADTKKPMWALTKQNADKKQDQQEEDEAEELLDFAAGLDFDKFIDDMEVRAMMEQVKGRVDELESAIAEEEAWVAWRARSLAAASTC